MLMKYEPGARGERESENQKEIRCSERADQGEKKCLLPSLVFFLVVKNVALVFKKRKKKEVRLTSQNTPHDR